MSRYDEARRQASIPIWKTSAALPDRLPPQNREAERAVLGAIILKGETIATVAEVLDVPDFYFAEHQVVFQAMKDLWEEGTPIDGVTLGDRLDQIRMEGLDKAQVNELLGDLVDAVRHELNASYHAAIVAAKAKMRQLMDVLAEGLHRGYSQDITAEELLDEMTRRISAVRCDEPSIDENTIHPAPDRMGRKAFHGIAGEIVDIITPQTEACPEAILGQFLVAFGNVLGPRAHWTLDATSHRCNLFLCLVGPTGIARKGTSWDVVRWLLSRTDPDWGDRSILGGLTSGEGLIESVDEAGGSLLVVESEFARLLTNASRDHSNLSTVVRQAWDGPLLSIPTRTNPVYCSNAYVSIIGHMTMSDLREKLTQNDRENGMANRFMWMSVYRDGLLPEGGDFDAVAQALDTLAGDVTMAATLGQSDRAFDRPVRKTPRAKEMWAALYKGPLAEVRTGDYAKVTVRAAPIILRLAVIYSILDRSRSIDVQHIEAAKAFWDYCDATAAHIFGSPSHDTALAKVIAALKGIPAGLTKGEINRKAFGGHARARQLDELLAQAQGSGLVLRGTRQTAGGAKTVWVHREAGK